MKIMGERRNRSSTMVILIVVAMILAFLVWSISFSLDQTSHARGVVIPADKVQTLQSVDGGEITDIKVREGYIVKRDQLLVVLDKVKLTAAVDEARARVAALKATRARVNAELLDKPLVFPGDVMAYPEFVTNQRILYTKRRAALHGQLSGYANQRALADEEVGLNEPLIEKGDVAKSDVIRMKRSSADLVTQSEALKNRYLQDLQAEFTKTQEDLVTAEQILTQRQDALKNAEIRAPTNGIVKNVRLTTVGGVFRPGDAVMEIVPTGEDLIVEAKVSPTDIAFVKVGQKATVKFDAYDSSIYGSATGTVTLIGPDTLVEQRPDGKAEAAYYRVYLSVDITKMRPHPGDKIEIQPGMAVMADITTGKNTVFGFLTKPILKTMGGAFGER